MKALVAHSKKVLQETIDKIIEEIDRKKPVWTRIAPDPLLPCPDEDKGACLDLRSWTQWDGFSCGAVAGWIVVNTYHPKASWREFYEHCAPSPGRGLTDSRLIASMRAFGVGIGIRKAPLSFAQIKKNIGIGYPLITTIDCPGEDVAHWVVIYGYSEESKGKNQKVYLANNSFGGIHHPQLANSVMPFHRFSYLARAHRWYICWGH